MRARRPLSVAALAILVAACGSTTPTGAPSAGPTTAPTLAPTGTPAPTATPAITPAAWGPFAGQPFWLDLPTGWQTFDLSDAGGQAALDEFVKANPDMAGAIAAFKSLPNAVFANNALLGNALVAFSLPSAGLSLDLLAQNFTAQFQAVPGLVSEPQPENVALPAGPAVHWDIVLAANAANGEKIQVAESLYLLVSDTSAVLVEFVAPSGATVPQEQQIMDSFRFIP